MSSTDRSSTWRPEVDADCTICRGDDRRGKYVVDGHHVVRCQRCRHLYVSPRPPMEDVVAIYGPDYFENPAFRTTDHAAYFGYMDYLSDRTNIQLKLDQVLERVERLQPPGRLLDVGCGPGLFVEVGAVRGWDSWGVDVNDSAIAWGRENITDNLRAGTVADLDDPDESFDCITMFDVIEHLADPRAELEAIWRLLKPGGTFVVVTPDAGAPVSRLLGSHWLEMKRAPEHLHFFSLRGLDQMLALCGFDALEWHTIGKVTSLRNLLADLRFYSEGFFGAVERMLDRVGIADRVFDLDPHTKMCVYARKALEPQPLEQYDPKPRRRAARTRRPRIDRRATPVARAAARATALEVDAEVRGEGLADEPVVDVG